MSTDNVTPIRSGDPEERQGDDNTGPSTLRLMQAVQGVCSAAEGEALQPSDDEERLSGLCTAAAILSRMLWEDLTDRRLI